MTEISWERTSCPICLEDLDWSADIAAHPPLEELGDHLPAGYHFMHEQCLEKNMLQFDSWHCPHCRGCLKTSGYTRINKTLRGGIRLRLVRNEFWRNTPEDADEQTILHATLQASVEDNSQLDIENLSSSHRFRFWDNVMVQNTEPTLLEETTSGEWERGCVMEVAETEVRVLLYESLRNEWFPRTALVLDPTQDTYWASEAIQDAILPLATSEELAFNCHSGSSGEQLWLPPRGCVRTARSRTSSKRLPSGTTA